MTVPDLVPADFGLSTCKIRPGLKSWQPPTMVMAQSAPAIRARERGGTRRRTAESREAIGRVIEIKASFHRHWRHRARRW